MITPPTANEIQSRILTRLRDEAGITADSSSSVARALANSVTDSVLNLWQQLAESYKSASIQTAVGEDLDKIGEFLGVTRRRATRAATQGYGPGVIFRNSGATPVSIPIQTAVFPADNPSIIFRTITAGITVAGYGTAQVDIEASVAGSSQNVAAGALNSHNLGVSQMTVSNPRAVDSGGPSESDDSYRTRLFNSVSARVPSSRQGIRQALTGLPGVRDVLLLENTGGAGTFDALLIGYGTSVPDETIAQAESYLSEYAPFGVSYRVLLPRAIYIDISVRLSLSSGSESLRSSLTVKVAQAVRNYIDFLSVEDGLGTGEFIFSELIERVGAAAFQARDYSITVSIDGRPLVNGGNYRPQIGERLTPRRILVE